MKLDNLSYFDLLMPKDAVNSASQGWLYPQLRDQLPHTPEEMLKWAPPIFMSVTLLYLLIALNHVNWYFLF